MVRRNAKRSHQSDRNTGRLDQRILRRGRKSPKRFGQISPWSWNKWGPQHQQFTPKSYNRYKKPSAVGLKASPLNKVRRCNLPEPELFQNRTEPELFQNRTEPEPQTVTPLQMYKGTNNNQWEVIVTVFPLLLQFPLYGY